MPSRPDFIHSFVVIVKHGAIYTWYIIANKPGERGRKATIDET